MFARQHAGEGISNKLIDRAFWHPYDLHPIWDWLNACEAIDQRGDKEPLIACLKDANLELSHDVRWYLADLLGRYQLKRKRGARAVPAYDFSHADVMFEMAKHAMTEYNKSLEEGANYAGIDVDQLRNYLEGKRGSSSQRRSGDHLTKRKPPGRAALLLIRGSAG